MTKPQSRRRLRTDAPTTGHLFLVPDPLWERVTATCEARDETAAFVVRKALSAYVRRHAKATAAYRAAKVERSEG